MLLRRLENLRIEGIGHRNIQPPADNFLGDNAWACTSSILKVAQPISSIAFRCFFGYTILIGGVSKMTKRVKKNVRYTLSTFAVEGLKPSKEAVKLYGEMSEGKRSLADTLKAIERNHGVAGGRRA